MTTVVSAPLGFGIVGCGGAAVDVARAIDAAADAAIVAVHDRDRSRAAALGRPRGATIHGSLARLLQDERVDAVYVAVPHDLLARTAVAALRAGRDVLVEKPVAIRAVSIRRLRDAAAENRCSVGVMFELRHVPTVAEARSLVQDGAIGRIRSVRIRTLIDKPADYWSSGPTGAVRDPWRASLARAGGGVVLMNSIHQLDLVRAITGLEARRVAALTSRDVAGVEVEDAAVAVIDWGDGVLGSLVAAAHAPGAAGDETIEIDGDRGALRLGDLYAERPALERFVRGSTAEDRRGRWVTSTAARGDPWLGAVETFTRAVRTGRTPVPGLDDAAAALATVLAIYRSARTGRFEGVRATTTAAPSVSGRPAGSAASKGAP